MMRALVAVGVALVVSSAAAQSVVDPDLSVERVVGGFEQPTGVAFLPGTAGDALVTEKATGRVRLYRGGAIVGTALDLPVANGSERGLLGITTDPHFATNPFVYLYYTASTVDGGFAYDNRIERYRWDAAGSRLTFDRHLLKMPAAPGANHDGGKLAFGPDGKLYAVIGDVGRKNRTANYARSSEVVSTAAILRLNPSGTAARTNPFFDASRATDRKFVRNYLYATGVRNSFGLAFDPVRGDLWDTENGPSRFDEINRVRPGFNSGWAQIMGPAARSGASPSGLVSLGERAYYSDPRFSWSVPIAPTDLHFLDDDSALGAEYEHDLFVGTTLTGSLLRFELSPSRKALSLAGDLADFVADNASDNLLAEQDDLIFGTGFGTITDLASGPGGLYVLSFTDGALYRITAKDASDAMLAMTSAQLAAVPEPLALCAWALSLGVCLARRRRRPRRMRPH
jgi:aldose sugar dehydrogenase